MRLLARLFFLLLAVPALLLGIVWGTAVLADFHRLNWTQRLVEMGIALGALTIFACCVYGFRCMGIEIAKAEITETIASVQAMDRLEARSRSWSQLLVFLLLLAIFASVAYLAGKEGNTLIFIPFLLMTLFFLALGIEHLRLMLVPGPMLAIDRNGLHHASYGCIAWQDVVGFRLYSFHQHGSTVNILRMGVKEPHRYVSNAGWMARLSKLGTLRNKPGHGVIDISLAALSVTPAAVMTMMERMRREVAPHLLQHWHESFSPKEVENMQMLQQFTADVSTLGENPSQEEMEAFERRMAARMPAMEAASRFLADQGKQRLQNLRKQTWIAVGAMGFLILLYALKIFSAL